MTSSVFPGFLIPQLFYFDPFLHVKTEKCRSFCYEEPKLFCVLLKKKGRWYKFNSLCFINFYLIFDIIYGQPLNTRLPSNSLPDLFPRLQDFALSDNICIWQHSTYICKSWEIDAKYSCLNNYIVGINNRHV